MKRLLLAILLAATLADAQPSEKLQGMLQRIFNSTEFSGGGRGGRSGRGGGGFGRWTKDGQGYQTLEQGEIARYDAGTGARSVMLSSAQLTPRETGKPLAISSYTWAAEGRKLLVMTNPKRILIRKNAGEYWVMDRQSGNWRRLGGDKGSELLFAKLSPDGTKAAYVRDTNLYVEDLATGAIKALTTDGNGTILNGVSDWVYDEEFGLSDAFRWSPDGRTIAYWQFDQNGVPEYTLINYTDAQYPKLFRYPYPKAGETNSAVRIGVVAAEGGPTKWIKVPGDPRNIYIPRMEWAGDREVILQNLNRLQNTNDVWLGSAATGEVRRLFQERDDAWVEVNNNMRWIDGGKRLLWSSEKDGWRHIYSVNRDGEWKLLTPGAFDVISVTAVDTTGGWLYFSASPDEPTRRYLYRTRLDGSGSLAKVTPANAPGAHSYDISPNGRWAFHTVSRFNQPPRTELVRLPEHETVRTVQENADLRAKVAEAMGDRTEFVRVDAGGGTMIDGWVMKPRNFDPSRKYPIVIYVYGEPAGANVVDNWSGNRALFHAALADEGYLVASFDNSGTPSPKGRAWRKVIYGSVGVLASQQQAAALRSLGALKPWVDLSRVAVWGWSGGGSMTDNLMFRSPDLYKVGVSVAAVPDQTLYDSIYQERYMGLPQSNAKGYHDGSPINFAEGLKGKLLVIHGTGDDNVHFQGDQRLINRLVELGKQFDFMEYPNRTHGISEGSGTSLHVYTLISRYLEEHLPPGPR